MRHRGLERIEGRSNKMGTEVSRLRTNLGPLGHRIRVVQTVLSPLSLKSVFQNK